MQVTLINHSSLLIKIKEKTFLTDFWNLSPAFGSWLPSALPFYNPVYLAALSYDENFHLVISHAHDDHIDDYFLKEYFNKNMKIILNEFPSPALKKRLSKLGFNNFITIPNDRVVDLGDIQAISVFDETVSNDDAGVCFRDANYSVHHGNDNWFKLKKKNIEKLKNFTKNRKFLYCSQTNSASGHPMSYPQYKDKMINELTKKVKKMFVAGLENVQELGADYFLPYAGYSKAYVKNKNYHLEAFDPTYINLLELIKDEKTLNKNTINKVLNIFCGGTFDFVDEKVSYPFHFNPSKLINITNDYLIKEKFINNCDTYNDKFSNFEIDESKIENYLLKFSEFVSDYLKRFPNFYPSIKTKKICFEVVNDQNQEKKTRTINLQDSKILENGDCNKKVKISSNLFNALYDKKIVFDNLYTGYEAEIFRYPQDDYNRDAIMYLDMFGYKYKNSPK